jgi:hypothetical protein
MNNIAGNDGDVRKRFALPAAWPQSALAQGMAHAAQAKN